ncbi:MAG: hypothetical protein QOG04_1144 [Actinomycetota bacterium]|jgi:hypothetical protein|nr:hypothetical protein [Actinomycetota bacterium]
MQADIAGSQRKVMRSGARPLRSTYGRAGIPVKDGKTLPFVVSRGWNAPAGYYPEAFYLVAPESGEVYYAGPTEVRMIWGLPSVTDVETVVEEPIALTPGTYKLVFALGGFKGGEADVEVFDAGTAAA